MDAGNDFSHALVPYKPSRNDPVREKIRRFFCGIDRLLVLLFHKRRTVYLIFFCLSFFGVLVGSYYSSLTGLSLGFFLVNEWVGVLLPLAFASGLSVFGLVSAPSFVLFSSFLFGCAFRFSVFSSVRSVLLFILFLPFCFLLFFFSVSSFLFAGKAFVSLKRSFRSRAFLLYCSEFVFCLFFHIFLSSLSSILI